jgi:hypothetical protein
MNDCLICNYWTARITEEKARALVGCADAYAEEKRVRQELAAHLERSHQPHGSRND